MKLFSQFLIASTLCLLSLGSSVQAADHIKDNLNLFTDKAKEMANQQIDQLYKSHGWMIAVETRDATATIPDLPTEKSEQTAFLKGWAKNQYHDNNIKGIYLVIFKNPAKYNFYSEPKLEEKMGVTQAVKNGWENLLEDNLRSHKYDLALLSTVGNMSAKLSRSNASVTPAAPAANPPAAKQPEPVVAKKPIAHDAHPAADNNEGSSMMTWLLVAGAVFIVFMIIRGILRGMSNQGYAGGPNQYGPGGGPNMGQPGYGPGYGAPSRGSGFMSGMLGGLFGGMAGNWMYDQFSGRNQAHGSEPSHSSNDGSHLSDNSSSDYTSSSSDNEPTSFGGGDWGGDTGGGGGDWGDSGGGDFGGDGGGGGDW